MWGVKAGCCKQVTWGLKSWEHFPLGSINMTLTRQALYVSPLNGWRAVCVPQDAAGNNLVVFLALWLQNVGNEIWPICSQEGAVSTKGFWREGFAGCALLAVPWKPLECVDLRIVTTASTRTTGLLPRSWLCHGYTLQNADLKETWNMDIPGGGSPECHSKLFMPWRFFFKLFDFLSKLWFQLFPGNILNHRSWQQNSDFVLIQCWVFDHGSLLGKSSLSKINKQERNRVLPWTFCCWKVSSSGIPLA